jgi:hypothetical protein
MTSASTSGASGASCSCSWSCSWSSASSAIGSALVGVPFFWRGDRDADFCRLRLQGHT